jgi:hypothetical protein
MRKQMAARWPKVSRLAACPVVFSVIRVFLPDSKQARRTEQTGVSIGQSHTRAESSWNPMFHWTEQRETKGHWSPQHNVCGMIM